MRNIYSKNTSIKFIIGALLTVFTMTFTGNSYSTLQGAFPLPRTGLIKSSADDIAKARKKHPLIRKVHLNRLGWQRANEFRLKHKLPTLREEAIAPIGKEIESAINTSSSSQSVSNNMSAASINDSSADTTLPNSVDNSASPWFPPIGNQGQLGSCGSFATTYYGLSYVMARENNWTINTGDLTKIFSPKWTYNMVNGGSDSGSGIYSVMALLESSGAPSWAIYPYDSSDYKSLPTTASTWLNALFQRIAPYQFIYSTTWGQPPDGSPAGLQILKQLLNNGDIINFESSPPPTYTDDSIMTINSCTTSACNPNGYTIDNSLAGQKAIYMSDGNIGHEMTIVGYDDNVWVDINGNGKVDPGEMGAFKVANQWGTGYGSNNGFWWIAYDALNTYSAVAGGPNANRGMIMANLTDFDVKKNPDGTPYTPLIVGQFTVTEAQRSNMTVQLGTSDATKTMPTSYFYPFFTSGSGSLPFTGTAVLDFTDILTTENSTFYLWLQTTNSEGDTQDTATLTGFSLIDSGGNTLTSSNISSSNPIVYGPGQEGFSTINYNYSRNTSPDGSLLNAGTILSQETSSGSLKTSAGTWAFSTRTGGGGNEILLNGNVVGSALTLLVYNQGQLYANISSGGWYLWSANGWNAVSGDPRAATLSAPTNLTANAVSPSQINLSWTASTGGSVSGYKIFRNGTQLGTSTSVSYSDTGLSASTAYSYTVLAYDANGNSSALSNTANIQTPATVSTISTDGSTLNAGSTAGLVTNAGTWDFSTATGIGGYDILLNGNVVGSALSLLVYNQGQLYANISSGAWYLWSANGWNAVSGDPRAATLSAPTNLTANAVSPSQINLSWTASTGGTVSGYKIFRNGTQLGTSTSVSYSDTGLSASTAYSYTVLAYDANGNSSALSNTANIQTPTTVSTISTDGSTLNAGSTAGLVTTAGTWMFSTATGIGGYDILLNGNVVGSAISLLVYNQGQLYANISSGAWYLWSANGWNAVGGDPRLFSQDGSTLNAGSTASLLTNAGTWTFSTATGIGGYDILLNGNVVGSALSLLVYNQGQLYANISSGAWYLWNGNGWNAVNGRPV